MFCDTTHFPSIQFCVPYKNSHSVICLSNNYHIQFDPKLGHGIFSIFQILCACDKFLFMLDKPWIPGLIPKNNGATVLSPISITGQF